MKNSLIYCAPWIVPIDSSPIRDGAIVVDSQKIIMVGSRDTALRNYSGFDVIELRGVAMPPLVNCHIHLELSYLKNEERIVPGATIVEWIEKLLQKRLDLENGELIRQAMAATAMDQFNSGVVLMVDIGNGPANELRLTGRYPEIYSILELLGPTKQRTADAIGSLSTTNKRQFISPHAPYSTSARLITSLKKRALKNGQLFSIHLAESADEIEFLTVRKGAFRSFLEKRESWDPEMLGDGEFVGAVDYLNSLDVLDDKTLCVHCVHVTEEEIALLAEKRVKVCLCPGSNEYLHVGRAPLEKMLSQNILPAVGTDSYGSNNTLDMWNEIKNIRRLYPSVAPETVLKMATLGGASALLRNDEYGSLTPGKAPVFLEIIQNGLESMTEVELINQLTLGGRPQEINWVIPS